MDSNQFYEQLLNLDSNWDISDVKIDMEQLLVEVHLCYNSKEGLCPFEGILSPIYDYAPVRRWRHLDTMEYQTYLVCRIPRVINSEGKVSTISVPWSDFSDRYTYRFASAVIELLQYTKNQTKTAFFFKTSFDVVNQIMNKAVNRGLRYRLEHESDKKIDSIGIDEKSYQKGHQYCTILTDATNKRILEVVADRTKEASKKVLDSGLSETQKSAIKVVTGDMWEAYQNTVKEQLPKATYVLDRFHLVKYLNEAIDKTRRAEVKEHPILKNSRFVLLKNPENLLQKQAALFNIISKGNYMVSQAYKIKEDFRALFGQIDSTHAMVILENWFFSTKGYAIEPIIKVVEMFKRHKHAIANSLSHPDSNAYAERMNGSIQELKVVARGFRNIQNFRIAILFHHGKLNLYPTLNFL